MSETGSGTGHGRKSGQLAKVGIFFVVGTTVIVDATGLETAEADGETLGHGGHFEFWQRLSPGNETEQRFKSHAYDYYPRGRVVYFRDRGVFMLYADRCLRGTDLARIAGAFDLSQYSTARDEHYQCAGCNPEYLDD